VTGTTGRPDDSTGGPSVNDLMSYEEEELFAILGQWAYGEGLGIRPRDLTQVVTKGREWLADNADRLRETVCGAPVVLTIRCDPGAGAMMDAATLTDLIATHFDRFPASVAAVIIVRRGLDWLCA
jgi:hypothetical protein